MKDVAIGSLIDDRLLDAIAQIESGGNAQAIGDRGLVQPAYGAFQMRRPAYEDVIRFNPQLANNSLAQVAVTPDLQREFARAYLTVLQQNYGMNSLDDLLAAYNAGVGRVKKKQIPTSTRVYISRIKQLLGE